MESRTKVTGTWLGTYSYNEPATIPRHESVPFTLILKQGWFKHFTGTVTDETPRGMPGTGVVDGHFSFPHIQFMKRMPISCTIMPDGQILTLREYLAKHDVQLKRDPPHVPIAYRGEFFNTTQAAGDWLMLPSNVPLPDGRKLEFGEVKGTWRIEAV